MMLWLLVIILSYLFFSLSFFGDKLILSNQPNAKLYTFFVGIFGGLVIFLIPFAKFSLPEPSSIIWIILEATAYLLAIFTMYSALEKFEVSKVVPAVGAIQPLLILLLAWFFWGNQTVTGMNILAFIFLFMGGVMISIEKRITITGRYLTLVFCSSLFFSLDYIFSKMIFLRQSFLQGLIWMKITTLLLVLLFLLNKELRSQIFPKKREINKKTGVLFLSTQSVGGAAGFLQSFAISLAPVPFLAIVNSLRGIQYVFLFLITLFFSFFFPKILKEDISLKIIVKKVISIALIVAGLALLVLH